MAYLTEDFNRSDENPLAGKFETLLGNGLRIINNQVTGLVGDSVAGLKVSELDVGVNQFSQIEVSVASGGDDVGVAVLFSSTGGGQGYIAKWETYEGRVYIYKVVAGSLGQLTAPITDPQLELGDVLKLKAELVGSDIQLRAYLNDVEVASALDDDSPITSGQPGPFYAYSNTGVSRGDNWAGGDGTGPGGGSIGRLVNGGLVNGGILFGGKLVR